MAASDRKRQFEGGTRLQPKEYGDWEYRNSNGGGQGWRWDPETQTKIMPPKWRAYLDWLLTDPAERDVHTLAEVAAQIGAHPDTVKRWRRDKRFREVWDREAREKNVDVGRVQEVVDALHLKAKMGDVKAAALYLQYVQQFLPTKRVIVETERTVAELSDDELADELNAQVIQLRAVA